MSIYVNGRCVDPDSSLTDEQRDAWVVRTDPMGDPQKETYGEVTFDVMCPGASRWRDLFIERVKKLVKTFQLDGVYIDQVSAATSHPCYSAGHDHDKPNQAWRFYKPFMRELREQLVQIKPEIFLATEGVSDVFGQYFDSQQAHNDWKPAFKGNGEPLDELYRYTYPNHVLLVGTVTDDPDSWFYAKKAHVLGCGIDFGVRDWAEFPEDYLEMTKWIQTWYAQNYRIFQKTAIYPVAVHQREIQVGAFFDSNRWIINGAWIPEEKDSPDPPDVVLSVEIPAGKEPSSLLVQSLDGHLDAPWKVDDGLLQIEFNFSVVFGITVTLASPSGEI
jgi:hypothetical protein